MPQYWRLSWTDWSGEGAVARLETCGEPNVAFYESLGFITADKVTLPDGAPPVWVMQRG